MNKIDLKKEYKSLFSGKKDIFDIVNVPSMNYIMIHGKGDPNDNPSYVSCIEALYSVAYTIKFICKKQDQDFVVMPLEGLWYADDYDVFKSNQRDEWKWTLLIMMPPYVTEEIFKEAVEIAAKKKSNDKIHELFFEEYNEGTCVQTLHIGSYGDEAPVISKMHDYALEKGYRLTGKHHEIYLSDPRKTPSEKLKTILRQPISK